MAAIRRLEPSGPPRAGEVLLAVRDLVVVRGGRRILDVAALDVRAGRTLAVVGPNGAGKSTLLLAMATLVRPDGGVISFAGTPLVARDHLAHRRRIGLVLPAPLLLSTSVFDNVAAGLRFRGVRPAEARERVEEWLERLGISHLRDRYARQISSGEAQRVSLARAFVLEPDLLLLDEPFASVDAATRAQLLDDLDDLLRTTPIACVLVTHDLDEAVRVGDRLAVLLDGRIRQAGPPEAVLAAPVDAEVAAFVGAETRLPGRVVWAHEGIALVDVGNCQIEAVSAAQPGRAVLCCLRPEDVTLWSVDGCGSGSRGDLAQWLSRPSGTSAAATPTRFGTSARNQLSGRVSRMVSQGSLVRVSIDCGIPLVASITRASAADMELEVGEKVVATFKASAVHLITLTG